MKEYILVYFLLLHAPLRDYVLPARVQQQALTCAQTYLAAKVSRVYSLRGQLSFVSSTGTTPVIRQFWFCRNCETSQSWPSKRSTRRQRKFCLQNREQQDGYKMDGPERSDAFYDDSQFHIVTIGSCTESKKKPLAI